MPLALRLSGGVALRHPAVGRLVLNARSHRKTIPTILITAYPDDSMRERALGMGSLAT